MYSIIKRIMLVCCRFPLRLLRDIDGCYTALFLRIFPSPYTVTGQCLKRGICCKNIAIKIHPSQYRIQYLQKLIVWWYEFVYNFQYKGANKEQYTHVFSCRYLSNNRCTIHWRRPLICRRFPHPPKSFIKPQLLPGCGYKVMRKESL